MCIRDSHHRINVISILGSYPKEEGWRRRVKYVTEHGGPAQPPPSGESATAASNGLGTVLGTGPPGQQGVVTQGQESGGSGVRTEMFSAGASC